MNKNQHLLSGAALFICGVTLGNLIDLPTSESDGISQDISQTQIIALEEEYLDNANYVPSDDLPIEDSGPVEPELDLREVSVKRGQGMMDILVTSGAERKDAYKAIKALSQHYDMKKLQIGQTLQAAYDAQGRLSGLNMRKNFDHMIRVNRTDDSFKATLEDLPSLTLTRHVQGVIEDSLFLSAYREGLPNSVIVDMIRIFSFDVDFQREIRKGDRFEIFYERKMSEDGRRVE
ncbi:MAG: hypothetical protein JKY59_04730 [Emcibacter sp.]|nr:hypothetical protein [Emcibacter sp.]